MERSTRLSIVEHALADVVERLRDLPPDRDARALWLLVRQYESEMALWEENPPDEATRTALLRGVLDLSVDVIRASGRPSAPPPELDDEDEYPKAI